MMDHMTLALVATLSLGSLALVGCASGPAPSPIPTTTGEWLKPQQTLVWVGQGESYMHDGRAWVRNVKQDYTFTVVQRRYADHWESVKTMHRRHPEYDGSAGARDQVLYFRVRYDAPEAGRRGFAVRSTLGRGRGEIDAEFTRAKLELRVEDASRFAPFDRYTIDQRYDYRRGVLEEEVQLVDGRTPKRRPFVRVMERAQLFSDGAIAGR